MRHLILGIFSLLFIGIASADVTSLAEAWPYLSAQRQSPQWLVIASPKNKGYVQCENVRTFVRCPFPISVKLAPHDGPVRPVESRPAPFPESPSAIPTIYLSEKEVSSIRRSLMRLGLRPQDVFSRMADKTGKVIGTAHDLTVTFDLSSKQFDRFVTTILSEVWQTEPSDGYVFEAGQWN